MTDSVIGKGVIEVSADSRKLTAGIDEAKRSLKSLGIAAGDATKGQSASIDKYVKSLGQAAVTAGKTGRELELYKLALRGASAEQLKAADSALRMSDAYGRGEMIGQRMKMGMIAVAAAGAAAAGVFTNMIISSINAADRLNDLSKTTGISVEKLSGLALAAKQSGTDLDGVAASISKLSQNIGKDGEKFRALGISAKDPLEAFKQLADVFAAIDDPQTQAALGAAALGKSWQSAAPLLAEGGKSIGEMVEKGMRLSGVTKQMAEDADKLNDQLAEMKAASNGLGMKMAGEMVGPLTEITNAVKTAYEESGKLTAAWVALGSIGAFIFTDEFQSKANKIKDLQFDLLVLEDKKKRAGKGVLHDMVFGSSNDILGEIEAVKKKIDELRNPAKSLSGDKLKPPTAPALKSKVASFIGGDKTGNGAAGSEAKAQLASDLSDIKSGSESLINTYSNAEKVMEAIRSAGLVDEKDYYASKLGLLNLNKQAKETALQDEIALLEKQKFVGKDKDRDEIDNVRKIKEARVKLNELRENSATSLKVLSIAEEAAAKKLEQYYRDAEDAAQSYLDTISRAQSRELAGMGAGNQERDRTAGRAQIEDGFDQKRRDLEKTRRDLELQLDENGNSKFTGTAKDKYDDELDRIRRFQAAALAEYDSGYAQRLAKQKDWSIGASEAMANYMSESHNIAKQSEKVWSDAFQSMEDALVGFVQTGKLDFQSLANSIVGDITRIIIKQQISNALGLAGGAGGGGSGGGMGGWIGAIAGMFGGGSGTATIPMQAGGGYAVGGVVTGPGSGTSDSIAAWLSNGEHVTNAEQTRKWLPLLEAINTGEIDRAPIKKFAAGGLVTNYSNSPSARPYLAGTQSGSVTPNDQTGGPGNTVHVTVNQSFGPGTTRTTTLQAAAAAARQLQAAGRNL